MTCNLWQAEPVANANAAWHIDTLDGAKQKPTVPDKKKRNKNANGAWHIDTLGVG